MATDPTEAPTGQEGIRALTALEKVSADLEAELLVLVENAGLDGRDPDGKIDAEAYWGALEGAASLTSALEAADRIVRARAPLPIPVGQFPLERVVAAAWHAASDAGATTEVADGMVTRLREALTEGGVIE